MSPRRAVIVGASGQDGRLLFELLRKKGYRVRGISRSGPVDVRNRRQVEAIITRWKPDEVYYLAAFHHSSQDAPVETRALFERSWGVNVDGLLNFLEAIRLRSPRTRLFYAASSHIFGAPRQSRVTEGTPINPNNVYGISKAAGLMACRFYRQHHGLFACVGILFNHASSFTDPKFISQKIIQGALAIKRGKKKSLALGDLSAEVDLGFAPDYVRAMHAILRLPAADDFIIASGKKHSVADLARYVFRQLGLDWKRYVRVDRSLITKRLKPLVGDPRKLQGATGWRPATSFEGMLRALLKSAAVPPSHRCRAASPR